MNPINFLSQADNHPIFTFIDHELMEETNLANQIKIFDNELHASDFIKLNANKRELLPDIILLDINRPAMDGWQFLDEYMEIKHSLEKKIKIYLVTSYIPPHEMARIDIINEVSDFVIKSITKQLFEKIVKTLDAKLNSLNKI